MAHHANDGSASRTRRALVREHGHTTRADAAAVITAAEAQGAKCDRGEHDEAVAEKGARHVPRIRQAHRAGNAVLPVLLRDLDRPGRRPRGGTTTGGLSKMGVSTDAILAYGYDLGGGDEWQVRELDEYGGLIPDTGGWVPDPEIEEDYDLIGLAERHLLDASGFTETYEDGREGYFGRERAAKEALGVEFETYCSDGSPMYLLAAKVLTVARGYVEDAGAFIAAADDVTRREWDAQLASAIAALGLTPVQDEPKWLLVSWRG